MTNIISYIFREIITEYGKTFTYSDDVDPRMLKPLPKTIVAKILGKKVLSFEDWDDTKCMDAAPSTSTSTGAVVKEPTTPAAVISKEPRKIKGISPSASLSKSPDEDKATRTTSIV